MPPPLDSFKTRHPGEPSGSIGEAPEENVEIRIAVEVSPCSGLTSIEILVEQDLESIHAERLWPRDGILRVWEPLTCARRHKAQGTGDCSQVPPAPNRVAPCAQSLPSRLLCLPLRPPVLSPVQRGTANSARTLFLALPHAPY